MTLLLTRRDIMHDQVYEVIKDLPLWREEAPSKLLNEVCSQNNINPEVVARLVAWERNNQHRGRRAGLTDEFDDIFSDPNLWEQV